MEDRVSSIVRERLSWIEDLRKGLLLLLGDKVHPTFSARPLTDKLTVILTITLLEPIAKNTRAPLRSYLRQWAKEGDCEVPRIQIEDREIRAEVLIKYRHKRGKTTFNDKRSERDDQPE